jgi:hypothetical protein
MKRAEIQRHIGPAEPTALQRCPSRLLGLSHVTWRSCVARNLSDHRPLNSAEQSRGGSADQLRGHIFRVRAACSRATASRLCDHPRRLRAALRAFAACSAMSCRRSRV